MRIFLGRNADIEIHILTEEMGGCFALFDCGEIMLNGVLYQGKEMMLYHKS